MYVVRLADQGFAVSFNPRGAGRHPHRASARRPLDRPPPSRLAMVLEGVIRSKGSARAARRPPPFPACCV
jgi:hypothetical protein